jgi:hypothetical protein
MPRSLFHLSDNEHTFLDDTGKQLDDSAASHAHALRLTYQVRRFVPEAAYSTLKIRITLASGQSVMTVTLYAVRDLAQARATPIPASALRAPRLGTGLARRGCLRRRAV